MVVSRSDSKRRKKEVVDSIQESPKRTKVHAQRKFAQGSHLNSPVLTPVKDKDKSKYNGTVPTAELLPIKRPKTEQFVNFLCFRGSNMLPKSLEFFNEPSIPEPLAGEEEKRDGALTSSGPSRTGQRTSEKHGDQASGVAKAEARNKNKSKSMAAVQALKKKYQEQRMNKEKRSLTKLALKVKGKNIMRTRSAGPLEEKPTATAALPKKPVRTTRLVTSVKAKVVPVTKKPVLRKHPVVVKRIPPKSVTRGGLRSGGGLPPGSDQGLKTERKPRKIVKIKAPLLTKSVKKTAIASSLSDFSSDDDQPLVKKQRVVSKASILASRVTTRSRLMSKPSTSQTASSRPPRKTKEAATLFMEMLKKDLRSPDEEEDNVDAMSVESFGETPKRAERRGSKDSTENVKSEKKSITKSVKNETKPNENKLPMRNNRKLPDKSVSRITSLKTRTLRRNSYRLVAKEIERKRLKTTRAKLINRVSSRSSSKEMSQDNSNEVEKTTLKTSSSERNTRRERRSPSNRSKTPENKVKLQKTVTKESDSLSSKVSKKKALETTFDDSDEEPLGKKVNQNSTSSSKTSKKAKSTSEKEGTPHTDKSDVQGHKLTRRRSVNATQDSSKEDLKQSAQTTIRAQQALKNTSSNRENENNGKVKPELTSKPKVGDNNSGVLNAKSKLLAGNVSETNTNVTQQQKETEKNTVHIKTQIEKKAKKSIVKGNEIKSRKESIDLTEKKKQPSINVKKSDSKKSLTSRETESSSNPASKEGIEVSEPKPAIENISKTEDNSTLKATKENTEKCSNLGKNISKKNITQSDKETGIGKNKNELPSSSVGDKNIIESGTEKYADVKSQQLKKDSNCKDSKDSKKDSSKLRNDKSKPSEECLLDSKSDEINKSDNKMVLESPMKQVLENPIVETKPMNLVGSKESMSNSPRNIKRKQPSSKKNSVNKLSNVDSGKISKEKTFDEYGILKESDENYKCSSTLKSNLAETGSSSTSPLNSPTDKSFSEETRLSSITKEVAVVDNVCSTVSTDVTLHPSTKNNCQKQMSSSFLKTKSNEKAKEEDLKVVQKSTNIDDLTGRTNKLNLLEMSNGDNSSELTNKPVNNLKDVPEDGTKTKDVSQYDSNNKKIMTESNVIGELRVTDPKLNALPSCSKGLISEKQHDSVSETLFSSGGTTLITDSTISNNCISRNKTLVPRAIDESNEVFPTQSTQPTKPELITQQCSKNIAACPEEKIKNKSVVLESTLSKNLISEGKSLTINSGLGLSGNVIGQSGLNEATVVQARDLKTDGRKLETKEENFIDNNSKIGNLDMADKISSAVETLMSLKNVQKIDEKCFSIQSATWSVKSGQGYEIDHKKVHEPDLKRSSEGEQKHLDPYDCKKVKIKEGEVKRVTIQEPEFKRFSVPETDIKRPNAHESDFRRFYVQDHKPKPEHPQVLKGCSNPKSMLKPGTLIDIAGISHSPEIMTPLRPGVDGEIIPMNRPIRPFGQDIVDPYKASVQGFKPYEPRVEHNTYGYRWQNLSSEKNAKHDNLSEKETADSKSKTPVNESAWRLAFKNVKDPKGSNNVPTEKPVQKKQLSVTALAKKHKSKSEIVNDKNTQPQSSSSIPFLRHNKPFLGPSPTKTKEAVSGDSDLKKSSCTDVDQASLREKEAEVEEFLRQCGEFSRSLAPAIVNPTSSTKVAEDVSRSGNLKPPYLPLHTDSSHTEEFSVINSEQMLGIKHLPSDVRCTLKQQPSHHDQPNAGQLFGNDNIKRAGSPLKIEKRQIPNAPNSEEQSPIKKGNLAGMNSQQDQFTNKQNSSSVSYGKDQSLNIFQIDSARRSNSPKSLMQKNTLPGTDIKSKLDESSFSSTSSTALSAVEQISVPTFLVGTHQTTSALNVAKQPLPDKVRHFSPNRSSQSVVSDNLFRESNLTKRTKSPTLLESYSQQNNSPKGNSISRNSNSPVLGKCSTTNIFKEIVPAKRSYSPTFHSTVQSDIEAVPNVFSQNQSFRRSVSPLSNRSTFSKLGITNDSNIETAKKSGPTEQKKEETCLQDGLKNHVNLQSNVNSFLSLPIKQNTISPTINENFIPETVQQLQSNKAVIEESLVVKEEVVELDETNSRNLVPLESVSILKQDIKLITQGSNEKLSLPSQDIESEFGGMNSSSNPPGMSEAKHRLPLAVEQTLKKLGQTRSPQNKKSHKVQFSEQNIQSQNEEIPAQDETSTVGVHLNDTQSVFVPKLSTGIYSHNQEGELDLMQKKKVNMSAEEIKRWLNDSSTSEVDHRVNCGILENNTCECEYRNTLTPNLQNIDTLKFETVSKTENICLDKSVTNQFDAIECTKKSVISEGNLPTTEVYEVKHSFSVNKKEEKDIINEIKKVDLYSPEEAPGLKPESQKKTDSNKITPSNELKEVGLVSMKNFCVPVSSGSSENIKQPPTTPPASKLRTFRLPNKNNDIEHKPTTSDTLEISTPARDDASSSNDLSSSNEETPEKSHSERKSIFHQRRSTLKVRERRELLAPSVNAFSPENESSVYAFDPELPPTSTPFRRSKGKDGKSTSTTTDDEDLTPSSNSIAVQVNFDNEAVLECSTQTDVQEGDDDDTHTFYIPLQQSAADTNKPPLIQGVAVKVDTEGPDQKVIMRAKLVTKPLSTFNQSSSSPRGLIGTRSGKPEQKVRPLSVKPPVGTVQPTARPKPKPVVTQDDQPGPSKSTTTSCSPQAARLAKRIKSKAAVPSTSAENHPPKVAPAKLVEAPTFYPTEKEFEDPLEYISSITPQAEKYGLCRVVPPSNFKPECKVSDDMRFTAYNQYIHKMLHRWGPNVKEMLAIKKYLATQSIALTHPPWIGGMEVDLPRLYQTVQQCGGLKEVIEKKRWHRVADLMKIPKSAQDRVTKLDDIYCKFLLPYDTLSHVERTQLFEGVEQDWIEREKRVANEQEAAATDDDDDSDSDSDSDIDECIVKGRSMALSGFYRIARNTMSMWFPKTDTPSAADVELEFWKHVASRQHHVCVHSGSIDSGAMGYGFPTGKNSSTSRHPWNLKMLTNNPGSILRFLGPIMGVTVPTLHVGMLFSACCWYRDPHGLPWIEYLHTGASKIWYGIPDSSSSQFCDAVMSIVPRLCRDKTLWLASDTAMVPPPLLVEKGVSLSRIVQDPGQFIIVFPKAFTSSICTGYLVSESVYFAQPSWLSTAQALFNDLRESSEPTVFSLEKLLFSIVNDSRASIDVLNQILGIVVSLRDGEVAGRRQLEELGLNTSERLNSKRKGKARPAGDGEEDLECDDCRMTLYISWMSNSQDGSVYCLPHAVELLSNKRSLVKHCTLVYAFSEEELEELVEKLKSRAEHKNQKKSVTKSSKS